MKKEQRKENKNGHCSVCIKYKQINNKTVQKN